MRKKIIILLFCVFVLGCSVSVEKETAQYTITITDSELNEQYRASDIFETVTLIPLETDNDILIGDISKILIEDSIIYILDKQTKSIMLFTIFGKFISKIASVGIGPNEYIYPRDFTVTKNKDILVLDEIEKLLHYKNDGSYYKTYRIPFYADALEPLNDSLFVFNGPTSDKTIYIWNINDNRVLNTFLDYDKSYMKKIFKPLIRYGGNVYYDRVYSSTVYRVTPEELIPQWFTDFGKRNINGQILEGVYGLPFILPSAAEKGLFTETDRFVTFYFQVEDLKEGMPHYVYYSKLTGKKIIIVHGRYNDDISFRISPPDIFGATKFGEVFDVLYPAYYLDHILKKDTTAMDVITKKRWEHLTQILKGVTETDNPIIALYLLKDF
jgi:hypothetical protein